MALPLCSFGHIAYVIEKAERLPNRLSAANFPASRTFLAESPAKTCQGEIFPIDILAGTPYNLGGDSGSGVNRLYFLNKKFEGPIFPKQKFSLGGYWGKRLGGNPEF